ncbi:hypothetical protein FQ775_21515 [Nitratireductor mangrovi]|uniref:Secreted protein n=1 Tax=Nitratireductor mangrovi TaxID=2599600 RepID=A0A5B8L4W4_9HYPH|nr:hypothetical protein [Nitratireductor mangrovi]QDZ02740.1 hypothetical protein FQ775_21515 [Nitratireductor mangrovi]
MTSCRICVAAAGVAAIVLPAYSAELSDGAYVCTLSSYMIGVIEIDGDVYRGPAFDGEYEGDYPFTVADNVILWQGPLGGLSSGGNRVVSTVLKKAVGGSIGFDITIQNERGNFQTISCSPE